MTALPPVIIATCRQCPAALGPLRFWYGTPPREGVTPPACDAMPPAAAIELDKAPPIDCPLRRTT